MQSQESPPPTALAAAIRAHGRRLHALAYRLLGDFHAAEDAVQDAYLLALRALHRFRGDSSIGTWLYRITSNVCKDTLRRRRAVPVDPSTHDGAAAEDIGEAVVDRARVRDALSALPVRLREAVVLTSVYGMDYREAGEVLGVAEGTVASRLSRARTALRAAAA